ncbi:MAG: PLP-dependent aspartate aminotransferase family protein [Wenzhouxiangellaceae bacterium]
MSQSRHDPATLCVHAGNRADPEGGINTPLSMATAYGYHGDAGVRYPRYFNTANQQAVCDKIAALENADDGVLFASGMAAISSLFMAHLKAGDHLLYTSGGYGGTDHFIHSEFPRLGIEFSECGTDIESIRQGLRPNTRMIYVETPGNPLLDIVDLAGVASLPRDRQCLLVADNTFATPIAQQPLLQGFDLVMHSATKYLGGHSDLSAGAIVGHQQWIGPIRDLASRYGGCLNTLDCWLLERSIKTLAVRYQQQQSNALQLAETLTATAGIAKVYYPGLARHPGHEHARDQMQGYGAMLSFELTPDHCPDTFENSLRIIRSAVSLGGVESTICRPILTSHAKTDPEKRSRMGINSRLMRLSSGIENPLDLLTDIVTALQQSAGARATAAC